MKDDAIKQIRSALNQDKSTGLVIYGAGQIGRDLIEELSALGIKPRCVCDGNEHLWGTQISNVEILSIDEAEKRFTNFLIYIASERYLCEIICQLTESNKILPERIINYIPVEKKYTCKFINERCILTDDHVSFCCSDFGRNRSPKVFFNGDYEKLVDDFLSLRDKTLHELEENIQNSCTGCRELSNKYLPHTRKAMECKYIVFRGFDRCNFRCSYCNVRLNPSSALPKLEFPEFVNAARRKGLLAPDAICDSANGEITIYPGRKKLYATLETFKRSQIFTNALIYDLEIAGLLQSGKGVLSVSLDAGTRETFAKIKGLDVFECVCNNLRQYALESERVIILKYIFLPDINDNEKDIDAFLAFAASIRVLCVIISYENARTRLPSHTVEMVSFFCRKADEMSLRFETNSDVISKATGVRNTY